MLTEDRSGYPRIYKDRKTENKTREMQVLQSDVISQGELRRASPQGDVLTYKWNRMFSFSLQPPSFNRTKIDRSLSSCCLLGSQRKVAGYFFTFQIRTNSFLPMGQLSDSSLYSLYDVSCKFFLTDAFNELHNITGSTNLQQSN